MILNPHKFALAAGLSFAFWFITDAFLAYMWPEQYLAIVPPLFHLTSLAHIKPYFHVTTMGALSGTAQWFTYTYLYAYVLAVLYNKLIN